MTSTLAIRSHTDTRYDAYAPYSTSQSSRLSASVVQARLHRTVGQDGCWYAPAPQHADTFAATKIYNPYAIRNEGNAPSTRATTEYNDPSTWNPQLGSTPPPDAAQSTPFSIGFASPTTNNALSSQLVPETEDRHAPFHQADCDVPFSHPRPQPHPSQSSFFSSYETPPSPAPATCTHTGAPAHTTLQLNAPTREPADSFQYSDSYQSNPTSTLSYPTSDNYLGPNFVSSRPHSSYHSAQYAPVPHTDYNERRNSISGVSPDETFAYRARDDQDHGYVQHSGYSLPQHTVYSSATPTVATTSPPDNYAQPQSLSPAPHTSVTSPPRYRSTPTEREPSQPAPTSRASLPGIGAPKSVQRRVGIMMDAQRQQSEQTKRVNQPQERSTKQARSRRRKPSQSDENDSDHAKSTTTSKSKSKDSRYKAAYERVRLQRDFFEGATSSLLHQVRTLGGDPMQASDRASTGEDLDPKKARLLIASLQRDLENSRERVIEVQTELHKLRQIIDESPRPHYSSRDEDSVPLSAAPNTVYNHLSK